MKFVVAVMLVASCACAQEARVCLEKPSTKACIYLPGVGNDMTNLNRALSGIILAVCFANGNCSQTSIQAGGTTGAPKTPPSVATPTFSVGAGAVAAGTANTLSDATSGARICYTWGAAPPDPTYDPTYGFCNGTSKEYRSADYASGLPIYKGFTLKALAHKAGMTDSAVASSAYTLTAASGTSVSSCGVLNSASTTYFLTADLTSTGTCLDIEANNISLNLNGHTITYGTGGAALTTGNNGTVNAGSATLVCNACTFTSAMATNHSRVHIVNSVNTFLNFTAKVQTFTNSHQVTLDTVMSAAYPSGIGFNDTAAAVDVQPDASYGILCNAEVLGGAHCYSLKVYNGSVVSSGNAVWGSHAIKIGSENGFADNENTTLAGLNVTVTAPEAQAIVINTPITGAGLSNWIVGNTVTSNVTAIYNRDQLPYPVVILNGYSTATNSPLDNIYDNQILNSPQGGILAETSTNVINNYGTLGLTTHYVNGYMVTAITGNTLIRGNSVSGDMRGYELNGANDVLDQNQCTTQDSTAVQDPDHNPTGIEIDGNFCVRTKNLRGDPADGSYRMTGVVISNNYLYPTAGAAPAQALRNSATYTGDAFSITNNILGINVIAAQTQPSSEWSAAGNGPTLPSSWGDMTLVTSSGNTFLRTGAFASTAYDFYISPDGAVNWAVGGLSNPLLWGGAAVGFTSNFTFTGSGAMVMHCASGAPVTGTYNGTSVPCT